MLLEIPRLVGLSQSSCRRVMEGTWGICGRRLFLPKSLSQVSAVQELLGTGEAAGEEDFPEGKGERKDFPFLWQASPMLSALQPLLRVWDLPQISPRGRAGAGQGQSCFHSVVCPQMY